MWILTQRVIQFRRWIALYQTPNDNASGTTIVKNASATNGTTWHQPLSTQKQCKQQLKTSSII